MVSFKKYFSCKCGANSSFEFVSDMAVEEITVSARCPSCSANIHVSVSALLSAQSQSPVSPSSEAPAVLAVNEMSQAQVDKETKENVEQAVRDLFKY
jgi:hypothetical protein